MNTALWYTTRATGVVALVLLTITVVLGIAGVSKLESTRWPRLVTALLHKNISLLPAGTLRAVALTSTIAVPLATTIFAIGRISAGGRRRRGSGLVRTGYLAQRTASDGRSASAWRRDGGGAAELGHSRPPGFR